MRLLTPTENKRLNELIGFLCITLGLLMALALISYSPARRGIQRERRWARRRLPREIGLGPPAPMARTCSSKSLALRHSCCRWPCLCLAGDGAAAERSILKWLPSLDMPC